MNLRQPITLLFAAFLALLPASTSANEVEEGLRGLAAADEQVLRVGFRLASANAARCPSQRQSIGALLQDIAQYPEAIRPDARSVLGLQDELGFTSVAPDSPASRAGIVPGTSLLEIDGKAVASNDGETSPTYDRLLSIEDRLQTALEDGEAVLTLRAPDGSVARTTVQPVAVCDIDIRVTPSTEADARTDDTIMEVYSGLVAEMRNDGELAAMLAHELGHVVKNHYRLRVQAGVKDGLAASFGKSAKIIRDQEEEADRLSVPIMIAAGYDPHSAIELWTHFAAMEHSFLMLNNHGSRKERRERIAEEIAKAEADGTLAP